MAQDMARWLTFVDTVMNLRFSCKAGNFLTSCETASFKRKDSVARRNLFGNIYSRNPNNAIEFWSINFLIAHDRMEQC